MTTVMNVVLFVGVVSGRRACGCMGARVGARVGASVGARVGARVGSRVHVSVRVWSHPYADGCTPLDMALDAGVVVDLGVGVVRAPCHGWRLARPQVISMQRAKVDAGAGTWESTPSGDKAPTNRTLVLVFVGGLQPLAAARPLFERPGRT